MKVKILEVGPRDGLQNEVQSLTFRIKWHLIKKLSQTGLKHIEVGAFVHPLWVPQMEMSKEIVTECLKWKKNNNSKIQYSALVPNKFGMERALETKIKEVSIFAASSESFSEKNINCSIKESFNRFKSVLKMAKKNKIKVRGYLSTAFGCPYEGKVSEKKVLNLIEKFFQLGVYEVSVSDTIGVANPKQVELLTKKINTHFDIKKIAMHFHDTRGMALSNVYASLNTGVTIFDSSIGGLGGCPYAKGASGNLATEDLVNMLDSMKIQTGIDLPKLLKVEKWLEKEMGRKLPSKMSKITN
jgi:hydroxymethylglutaryl-CoA lyase